MRAKSGSAHGYDVVDPLTISPVLGGREGYERLVAACRAAELGIIVDIVPNHMAAHEENPWWRDVLMYGQASRFAPYFDIHWDEGGGQVFLPVLDKPFGDLADGELSLVTESGDPEIAYYDRRFPIRPESLAELRSAPTREELDTVVARQHYVLGYWRDAIEHVNYRRFFDINDLVGVAVERPEVFEATHRLIGELATADLLDGVRVDHIDGLKLPGEYLERLQELLEGRPIWVEKILDAGESIPSAWPVAGTTGYDFLGAVDRLLVARPGVEAIGAWYRRFAPGIAAFPDLVRHARHEVLIDHFGGEYGHIVANAVALVGGDTNRIRHALTELTVALPRYRTYGTPQGMARGDMAVLTDAADAAVSEGAPAKETAGLLKLFTAPEASAGAAAFVLRWQQLTGPVAAKGVEDTAMYRDNRLVSLNDVGRSPREELPAITLGAFHDLMTARAQTSPQALNASSTHDNKRSEDVRYRLHVVTEDAGEWIEWVERWHRLNAPHGGTVEGQRFPAPNTESGIYQALLGTWPGESPDDEYRQRISDYVVKAARERSLRTSWQDTDQVYERALRTFVGAILDPARSPVFIREMTEYSTRISRLGALNGLTATLLKLTCPGVPDFYQGHETEVLSLVDPDNRRPVDFGARKASLGAIPAGVLEADWWWQALAGGRAKQTLVKRALAVRRVMPQLFASGDYVPLPVRGDRQDAVVAFARGDPSGEVCIIAPRHWQGIVSGTGIVSESWATTEVDLPRSGSFHNAISGRSIAIDGPANLAHLLADAPIALLVPATTA